MITVRARRWLAIGLFGMAGSIGAFGAGASLATKLERRIHGVSIAKIPVHDLTQAAHHHAPPPNAVAKK